jgi:ABC-type lipoprotein export system ATPase subunit
MDGWNVSAEVVVLRDVTRELTLPTGETIAPIQGVTATIYRGDRIALVGPSGSGKTTFVHLCGGLEAPTSGTVEWPALPAGPVVPGVVGVVFQAPSLIAWLSVEMNVAVPLLAKGVGRDAASTRANEMLARFGLESMSSRLPEELSGGQAQRVALARALVASPALVLADEPTGQLDGTTARSVIAVLLEIAPDDCAIVFATHDQRVSDRFGARWTIADGTLARS